MEGCQADTVWTWNAIGKQSGNWGLSPEAPEARKAFLLNHLISELLPEREQAPRHSNSDPITGQAAWYDLRVRVTRAAPGDEDSWPQFETVPPLPGQPPAPGQLRYHTHEPVRLRRTLRDILTRK
jgi:hypothetical protein